jgi:hypothetical protein
MLHDLRAVGIVPSGAAEFETAVRVMNEAAHGIDVEPHAAEHALDVGSLFLSELKRT